VLCKESLKEVLSELQKLLDYAKTLDDYRQLYRAIKNIANKASLID
jgi:hypothetical protein